MNCYRYRRQGDLGPASAIIKSATWAFSGRDRCASYLLSFLSVMEDMAGEVTRSGREATIEAADDSRGEGAVELEIKKKLFRAAMESQWKKLMNIYKENKFAPIAINRGGDTILHLAISIGNQHGVIKLMKLMKEADCLREILETKNKMGDAPIHEAAILGMDEVCLFLGNGYPEQVLRVRNEQDETPLHVAVLHGQKKAFFALQAAIDAKCPQLGKDATTNRDGDTILHTAISKEHFDLAWEIIHMNPNLKDLMNTKGESALHILATKPSAFKSGTDLNIIETLIYCSLPSFQPQPEYPTYRREYARRSSVLSCIGCGSDDDTEIEMPEEEDPTENSISIKEEGDQPDQGDTDKQIQRIFSVIHEVATGMLFFFSVLFFFGMMFIFGMLFFFGMMFVFGIYMLFYFGMLSFFGLRPRNWNITEIKKKIKEKKRKNSYAYMIMEKLVTKSTIWLSDVDGRNPKKSIMPEQDIGNQHDEEKTEAQPKKPTEANPFLAAARSGIIEMVKKFVEHFPDKLCDADSNGRNVVLLAAEYRQPQVYEFMLNSMAMSRSLFRKVDKYGNSALHLAAQLSNKQPRTTNGPAQRMQWEVKWYKYVMNSMPPGLLEHCNNEGKTPESIFTNKEHKDLVEEGRKWLTKTSGSCSVVAALIATVAFTTATTLPGGVNQSSGFPLLDGQPGFKVFAISALVALCFSVTSLVMFLSFVTSSYRQEDFEDSLPAKLMLNLTSLFLSIAAMLVAFCAGHFFLIEKQIKRVAYVYLIYVVVCLPVTLFGLSQFPLYFRLLKATFARVPERGE